MRNLIELNKAVILSEKEIEELIKAIGWPAMIDAVCETFTEEAMGRTKSPSKVIIDLPKFQNDYRVMPSYMEKYPNYCGTKIVSACANNPARFGLPLAMGVYLLNEAENQQLLMLSGANMITAYRTAAATAVAVRAFAPQKEISLGIIGCGQQAYYHIEAIGAVRKIKEVLAFDINYLKLSDFLGTIQMSFNASTFDIIEECDVVVTLTPSVQPFIHYLPNREMLVCAIGGDSDKKSELDGKLTKTADVFCDSIGQVSHTGTIISAIRNKHITIDQIKPIGKFLTGERPLDDSKPVKMFFSTGVALEDLITAIKVYESL